MLGRLKLGGLKAGALPAKVLVSEAQAQFSADGAVVEGVSHDDLYALWCRVAILACLNAHFKLLRPRQDADHSGRVSYHEWTNGIYRLRLDAWPVLTELEQGLVVDKISAAAAKWIGNASNWYKARGLRV